MLALSLKKRILSFIITFILTITLIVVFILVPAAKDILELGRDITSLHEQLDKKYAQSKFLRQSIMESEQIKQEVKKYSQAWVKPGDELKIITELENLAHNHNIEQTLHISFVDEKKDKKSSDKKTAYNAMEKYYQLSFLNTGSFPDQVEYLKALEELPYYIIIDSLHWQKKKGGLNSKAPLTLRFDAIVYAD